MRQLIALVLFFFALSVHATSAPTDMVLSGLGSGDYVFSGASFHLGYTAGLLSNGIPLGSMAQNYTPPAVNKIQDLGPAMKIQAQNNANGKALADSATQKALAGLHQYTPDQAQTFTSPTSPTSVSIDLATCAGTALALLKQRLRLNNQLNTKSLAAADTANVNRILSMISTRLQDQRSDSGIYCGKGTALLAKAVLADDVQQIKLLSAIAARQGAELEQVLQATALAFDPAQDAELRAAWSIIWNRITLAAVFTHTALPAWQDIIKSISQEPASWSTQIPGATQVQIDFTREPVDYAQQVQRGLDILGGQP